MLQPAQMCNKTGERVMKVLHTKHLDEHPLPVASIDTYPDRPPDIVPVDITDDTVTEVAGQLSGGSRPVGTGSVSL